MDEYCGDRGSSMGRISRSAAAFVQDYVGRHRHPVNAVLHLVGVPAVFYGLFYMATARSGRHRSLGLAFIVIGYVLQYLGHKKQGNEVGEVTLIKYLIARTREAGRRRLSLKWMGGEEYTGAPVSSTSETVSAGKSRGAKDSAHGGNGHGGNGHNGGGNGSGRFILWWKTSH